MPSFKICQEICVLGAFSNLWETLKWLHLLIKWKVKPDWKIWKWSQKCFIYFPNHSNAKWLCLAVIDFFKSQLNCISQLPEQWSTLYFDIRVNYLPNPWVKSGWRKNMHSLFLFKFSNTIVHFIDSYFLTVTENKEKRLKMPKNEAIYLIHGSKVDGKRQYLLSPCAVPLSFLVQIL